MEQQKLLAPSRSEVTGLFLPTTIAACERAGAALYEPGKVVPQYYEFLDQLLHTALGSKTDSLGARARRVAAVLAFLNMALMRLRKPRLLLSANDPILRQA
jgi:hypothetical protein